MVLVRHPSPPSFPRGDVVIAGSRLSLGRAWLCLENTRVLVTRQRHALRKNALSSSKRMQSICHQSDKGELFWERRRESCGWEVKWACVRKKQRISWSYTVNHHLIWFMTFDLLPPFSLTSTSSHGADSLVLTDLLHVWPRPGAKVCLKPPHHPTRALH